MADNGSTAGLYILITFLIILVVVALLWFGGVFNRKKTIDINVNPGIVLQLNR
jgi:hypothetical protein